MSIEEQTVNVCTSLPLKGFKIRNKIQVAHTDKLGYNTEEINPLYRNSNFG